MEEKLLRPGDVFVMRWEAEPHTTYVILEEEIKPVHDHIDEQRIGTFKVLDELGRVSSIAIYDFDFEGCMIEILSRKDER